jgi:nicotinate-nucleotide adenylyltransferase
MTIGVLGGTFDPPHLGHVGAAEYVLNHGLVSRVLVIPVFSHAFAKEPLAPFADRLQMCQLAFAHLPEVTISDIEKDLPTPNYTISTIRSLSVRFPEESFRIIIGSDVVSDLPRWRESDALLHLAPPLVLERQGYPSPLALQAQLPLIASSELRVDLRELGKKPNDPALTERISRCLPKAVFARILEKGLYQG